MRIDLQVPRRDIYEIRRLGARWDMARKCWYIVDVEDLRPFLRWMPKHMTAPHKPKAEA